MANIHVLIFSKDDWKQKYNIPDFIEIEMFSEDSFKNRGYRDLVILDRDIDRLEKDFLLRVCRAYCLYITENAQMKEETLFISDSRVGKRLYTGDLEPFWTEEAINYFAEPYGEKLNPTFLQVNQLFRGKIAFYGKYDLRLEGDFGDDFSQIVYWKNNLPIGEGQCIDLYFEHSADENVEVKLRVYHFYNGSISDLQQVWEFDNEQLKGIVHLDNTEKIGPIFFSVLAKGKGSLRIVSLHDRHSRRNQGFFLPGGKRYVTSKGEEIFAYFDPGDLKPPITFYFSGYRRQEGFEGYYMMRNLGCPMVLLTDPRLEGGSFYLGDKEYETLVVEIINKFIKIFHGTSKQAILTGNSMGTFAAMYYGCDIKPYALVLGKPLASLGTMAKHEKLERIGVFPTSLELLLKEYGALDENAIDTFNKRFWDKFNKADWTDTKFIISYLYEDDYDSTAYQELLSHLDSEGVQVYGKGIHGRHNDNTQVVIEWFKIQIERLLRVDFKRK